MKIVIHQLKENQNMLFEESLRPEDYDLNIGVMRFPQPLRLEAEAWKSDEDLTVRIHIEGEAVFSCSSCLEEFNKLIEKDMTLHYDIKGLDSVTLDSEIREEIILEHPIRILCREDCRGLCPQCGANLNRQTCACSRGSGSTGNKV